MVCVIRSECESIFLSCEKCWSFKEFFVPNPCALKTYQNDCVYLFIFPEKWGRGGRGTEQSWENKEFGTQVPLLSSLWVPLLVRREKVLSISIFPSFKLPSLSATTEEQLHVNTSGRRVTCVSPSSQILIGDFDFSSCPTKMNWFWGKK